MGANCRGHENMKMVFRAYFRQKWIDLRQTKTKMIGGSFYTLNVKNLSVYNTV